MIMLDMLNKIHFTAIGFYNPYIPVVYEISPKVRQSICKNVLTFNSAIRKFIRET